MAAEHGRKSYDPRLMTFSKPVENPMTPLNTIYNELLAITKDNISVIHHLSTLYVYYK